MKISTYSGNARSMAAIYSAGETGSQAFLLALIDNNVNTLHHRFESQQHSGSTVWYDRNVLGL